MTSHIEKKDDDVAVVLVVFHAVYVAFLDKDVDTGVFVVFVLVLKLAEVFFSVLDDAKHRFQETFYASKPSVYVFFSAKDIVTYIINCGKEFSAI